VSISATDSTELGISTAAITDLNSAVTAIGQMDTAIDKVSDTRSALGFIQNRLAYTVATVDNAAENLASSESTIRDLDISNEITNFTKAQILTQAGMSMLAQANAVPQNVLALFR